MPNVDYSNVYESLDSLPSHEPIRKPSVRSLGSYAALSGLDDLRELDRLESESFTFSSFYARR
jgi:hypothetical protein